MTLAFCVAAQHDSGLPPDRHAAISASITRSFRPLQDEQAAVVQQQRDRWIVNTIEKLQRFTPGETTAPAEVRTNNYGRIRYWIDGEGLVRFEGGQWLYIIAHSAHVDERIGSITLAVDQAGNLYANRGHFCDRFTAHTSKGNEFHEVSDFLSSASPSSAWEQL